MRQLSIFRKGFALFSPILRQYHQKRHPAIGRMPFGFCVLFLRWLLSGFIAGAMAGAAAPRTADTAAFFLLPANADEHCHQCNRQQQADDNIPRVHTIFSLYKQHPLSLIHISNTQFGDNCTVSFNILFHQVVEQIAAAANHLQKASSGMVVFFVHFQVFGQFGNCLLYTSR